MQHRRFSTIGLGLAGALLAGVLLPGSASAAPGDASARGVIFALNGAVGGVPVVTANRTFGAADAPPGGGTAQDANIPVALPPAAPGVASAGTVNEVRATRGPTASSAFVRVTGAGATILGVPAFSTGDATATAVCPAVGAITATTTLTGFTLLGTPTTLAPNAPPVTRSVGVVVPGLTGAQLTATARRVETTTATDAFALAVEVTFAVTGTTLAGAPVTIPLGTVQVARATCTRPTAVPAAPTAAAIAPARGPTSGGQTVTITGTGFVPGATTVTFDGVPATAVTVSPDGRSLTAVTPAGAAGPAAVVVSTAGGAAAPLAYTYVAPGGGGAPGGGSGNRPGPSVAGLDPDHGPTSGGTRVTVRGSNFVPGQTSVLICGRTLPPSVVEVAAGGRSLTFATPACGAGIADVVVATRNGASASLPFTYGDPTGPAGSLANTGADVAGTTLWAVILLVVGAALTWRGRRRPVAAG